MGKLLGNADGSSEVEGTELGVDDATKDGVEDCSTVGDSEVEGKEEGTLVLGKPDGTSELDRDGKPEGSSVAGSVGVVPVSSSCSARRPWIVFTSMVLVLVFVLSGAEIEKRCSPFRATDEAGIDTSRLEPSPSTLSTTPSTSKYSSKTGDLAAQTTEESSGST